MTRTCASASTGRWRASRMRRAALRRAQQRSQGDRAPAGDRRHAAPRARTHPRRRHHALARRRRTAPSGHLDRAERAARTACGDRRPRRDHDPARADRSATRPGQRDGHARPTRARAERRHEPDRRGARVPRARRRPRAHRRPHRRRRRVHGAQSTSSSSRPVARRDDRLPLVGEDAPRDRPRGAGDGRARARHRARHALRACRGARRALSVELAVTPRGPYSLSLSARLASDATRTFREGLFTQVLDVDGRIELARAWQAPQGTVDDRALSRRPAPSGCAGSSRSTTTTPTSCALVRDDPMLGRASRELRGLRPVRVPDRRPGAAARVLRPADRGEGRTPARADDHPQALRRQARSGSTSRRRRAASERSRPCSSARSACTRAGRPRSCGSAGRSISSACTHSRRRRSSQRLERERGLGPWSVGVVCLEGLGRAATTGSSATSA